MNMTLYEILSDTEIFKLKNTDVRNVRIGDLTINELQIIFLFLFNVPAFSNVIYPSVFTHELLIRRIDMRQALATNNVITGV